jgi:glycosyltransferase involved in cell wall biosynthesis
MVPSPGSIFLYQVLILSNNPGSFKVQYFQGIIANRNGLNIKVDNQDSSLSPKVSIIVPAYNEAANIAAVLENLLAQVKPDWEIIVVDDGSTDETQQIISAIKDSRLVSHRHPYNIGYGAAIKTGIRWARGELIVLFDSDSQQLPEDIYRLQDASHAQEYDMVVGTRSSLVKGTLLRQPGKWVLSLIANYIAERNIPDLNSGLRVIKKDVIKGFLHILPNGFSLTTTTTLAFYQAGHSIGYIPISAQPRVGQSTLRWQDGFNTLLLIVKTVMLFSPLKIFGPASIALFLFAIPFIIMDILLVNIADTTVFLTLSAWLTLAVGLLADQMAAIRRELGQTK